MSVTQKSDSNSASSLAREDKNHIPVIDRMLDILELIELRQSGIVIKDLCERLSVPRSTVYRILNTLEARDVVKRAASGAYVLGPRLMNFAANVTDTRGTDIAQIAVGPIERLSLDIGQSVKVSIVYNGLALVVCCAQSTQDFAITVRPGRTIPLHSGAASKILLANVPEAEREKILSRPLRSFTSKTITDPDKLREELEEVRATDWSVDVGEHGEGIHAMATSIRDGDGNVVAAISIPYLGTHARADLTVMRQSLIKTAQAISKELRRHSS
jgi:DNA-binding IclR family transcriptional regulator